MASMNKTTAAGDIHAPEETADVNNNAGVGNNNSQNGDNDSLDGDVRDEKTAAGLTRFQKIIAHFGRFKWWYLLALVVILAILLPIL